MKYGIKALMAAGVLVYALQNRGQGDATVATPAVTPAALATED